MVPHQRRLRASKANTVSAIHGKSGKEVTVPLATDSSYFAVTQARSLPVGSGVVHKLQVMRGADHLVFSAQFFPKFRNKFCVHPRFTGKVGS
jgi:hypothetical protein